MKKIISFALAVTLLFVSDKSISQTISDSFYLQMTHIFQHVDTTKVTTGLLKDYGIDFADVINFDGVQVSDTNIVFSNIWNDLYTVLLQIIVLV